MPIRRATTRKCATCRYWTGEREFFIDGKGKGKFNLRDDAIGTCRGAGTFKDKERLESKSCVCYAPLNEKD